MQTAVQTFPARTPANEVQNVADYQAGWNDAQAKREPRQGATIYYTNGFVDACAHEVRRPQ